jgi:tetratricopeptide (TPR) repeat protein
MRHTPRTKWSAIIGAAFLGAALLTTTAVIGKEELGQVQFKVSCAAEAQQKFNHAMALYHSFAWKKAQQTFTEITAADPKCGMAWWGLAMVAADNPFGWPVSLKVAEGAEAIDKAKQVGAGTARERDYIAALDLLYKDHATTPHRTRALAYEAAMDQLAQRHADDVEAKILAALAVSANHDLNDKTFARPLKAAAALEPLFAANPQHPGIAHYLVHSYDYPPIAAKGLHAAKRYAEIAPAAPHAQHMPSHIFTRVGYWRESIVANQQSVKAAVGDALYTAHGMDYMVYAHLQLAEDATAVKVSAESNAIRPEPGRTGFGTAFGIAAIPARLALERGRWAEAAKLETPSGISEADWKRFPQAESINAFARAIGAARSGDAAAARREIDRLSRLQQLLTERKLAYWAEQTEVQAKVATAWVLRAERKDAEALAALRAAADHEDRTEKHVVTPGPILPAREMLGDLLMELNRPAEALAQYEAAMAKEPNRFRGLYGAARAAELAGDREKARTYYGRLMHQTGATDNDRAELRHARAFMSTR